VLEDNDFIVLTDVESGVCAILSKGWSDRLQTETTTKAEATHPDVFTVQSIPHDWLFPQLDAACHHGGSGTLGASLRAGIPTIVKPYFGDQFFWASQVESLQIGAFVRNFGIETFSKALIDCTTDVKLIENAKKIGAVIRAEDGVGNAIRAFYGDWEYACSRIPRDGKLLADARVIGTSHAKPEAVSAPPLNTTKIDSQTEDAANCEDDKNDDEDDDDDEGLDGWSVVSESEEEIPPV